MKQSEAEEMLKMGYSALLTGPAGCGKTFLLNKYINYLKKKGVKIGITASTGLAATHLNGRTIHSWCRMGINETMTDKEIEILANNEQVWARIKFTSTLIIDEISMLNASRLDLVNRICQIIRQDLRPFGGLQVILCGDFFQLPPVAKKGEDGRFVTESEIWNKMDLKICYLDEQFRQADQRFLQVLNSMRENKVTREVQAILQERLNQPVKAKIEPTKLYTHNQNVDVHNFSQLAKLPDPQRVYEMRSTGVLHLINDLKKSCLAYETLPLKKDAVVMFIKNNFDKKYVNGTLGKVIGFDEDSGYPEVETISGDRVVAMPESWAIEDGGEILASISQVPLRLAWAITVHKSQGMSLDCAEIDLSQTFEYGMGYVALSRVRSLQGIKLLGLNELALKVNEKAIKLDKVLQKRAEKDFKEYNKISKGQRKKRQKSFLEANKKNNSENTIFGLPF